MLWVPTKTKPAAFDLQLQWSVICIDQCIGAFEVQFEAIEAIEAIEDLYQMCSRTWGSCSSSLGCSQLLCLNITVSSFQPGQRVKAIDAGIQLPLLRVKIQLILLYVSMLVWSCSRVWSGCNAPYYPLLYDCKLWSYMMNEIISCVVLNFWFGTKKITENFFSFDANV